MEGFKAALFKRFLEKVIMRSRTKEQKIRYYIFRVMTAGDVSCGQDWKHSTNLVGTSGKFGQLGFVRS